MKIAVSGASHSGKSTIVNHIRDALTLPLIGENRSFIRKILNESNDINKVVKRSAAWVSEKLKEEQFLENSGYVSDRCSLDIFSLCCVLLKFKSHKDAQALHDLCREKCSHYDYLIIPQWGSVAYRNNWDVNTEPVKRLDSRKKADSNPWFNLNRHITIVGLAYTWLPPEKILLIPREVVDINERVEWIRSKIGA